MDGATEVQYCKELLPSNGSLLIWLPRDWPCLISSRVSQLHYIWLLKVMKNYMCLHLQKFFGYNVLL